MLDFLCFNVYLRTYGLHHFLNRFVIFNKNFLVPLDQKELLIFRTLIVPSLRCALIQLSSLWARKRIEKNGGGSYLMR